MQDPARLRRYRCPMPTLLVATLLALPPAGFAQSTAAPDPRPPASEQIFGEAQRAVVDGHYARAVGLLGEALGMARQRDAQGRVDEAAIARAKAELESLRKVTRERIDYLRTEADAVRSRGSHDRLRTARDAAAALSAPLEQLEARVEELNSIVDGLAPCRSSLVAYPVFEQSARSADEAARMRARLLLATSEGVDAAEAACAATTAAEASRHLAGAEGHRAELQRQCDSLSGWATLRAGNAITRECLGWENSLRPVDLFQAGAGGYEQALDRFAQGRDAAEAEVMQRLAQAEADRQRLESLARDLNEMVYAYDKALDLLGITETAAVERYYAAGDLLQTWASEEQQARSVLQDLRMQDVAFDRKVLEAGNALAAQARAGLTELARGVSNADDLVAICRHVLPDLARKLADASACAQQAATPASGSATANATAASPPGAPSDAPPGRADAQPSAAGSPAPGSSTPEATPSGPGDVFGGLEIRGAPNPLRVGGTAQLAATDKAGRPYPNVRWTSFEPDVLQVHGDGSLLGLRPGTVTVQATVGEGLDARVEAVNITVQEDTGAAVAGPAPPSGEAQTAESGEAQPADARTQDLQPDEDEAGHGFTAESTSAGPADETGAAAPDGTAAADALPPGDAPSAGGFTDLGTTSGSDVTLLGAGAGMSARPPGTASPAGPPSPPTGATPSAGGPGGGGGAALAASTQPVAGRPVPYHVFATGSRLGWAAGLARYSVGPADDSIATHLRAAGEHAMWANRESLGPLVAWPDWSTYKASFDGWASELARAPSNNLRRQISIQAGSSASALGSALASQMAGDRLSAESCEAAYVRLGYQLAYAQQALMIADEAASQGALAAAASERADAFAHLQAVRDILTDYEQIRLAAGRCADLTDVRARLDALTRLPEKDYATQARTATETWDIALARIAALAQPAAATARPSTGATAPGSAATSRGPSSPTSRASAAPSAPTAAAPGVAPDIVGDWFLCAPRAYQQPNQMPTLGTRVWIRHCLDERNARPLLAGPDASEAVIRIAATPEGYVVTQVQPGAGGAPSPASPPSAGVAQMTRTGADTFEERRGGIVRAVRIDGDLLQIAPRGRPYVEYYVRRERRSAGRPTLVRIPEYGPAAVPGDLSRYTRADLRFEYGGLSVQRESTSQRDPSPGSARLAFPASRVELTEAPTGRFDATTFTAVWRKPGGYTGFFPETGSFGSCLVPTSSSEIRGSLQISVAPAGDRIASLRVTFEKAATPTGGFPQCTAFENAFRLELAGIPYVRELSTPSRLIFQFPVQSGGETACSRVRALEGGGQSTDDTGVRTWRISGFDCDAKPGIVWVELAQPEATD